MISLTVPGVGEINLEHAVFDVNGTIALDGELLPGISDLLQDLRQHLKIHLLTADTHGRQVEIDQQLNLEAVRIRAGDERKQKSDYIYQLGPEKTVAIGQGANDGSMLEAALIGICVISEEGTALETLLKADLVVPDIRAALEILLNPTRLKASLRK